MLCHIVVCGGLRWVCGGFCGSSWWFMVVSGGSWWFVVVYSSL